MSQPVRARLTVAVVVAALALISGAIVKAQIGVTPYKVNYNWDKLEGRKIGVASGIKLDPDGQHLWILERCGANGCANPHLTRHPGRHGRKFVRSSQRHHELPTGSSSIADSSGLPTARPPTIRAASWIQEASGHQIYKFSHDGKLVMTLGEAGVPGADEKHFNGPTGVVVAQNGDIWITDGRRSQCGPNKDNMYAARRQQSAGPLLGRQVHQVVGGGIGSKAVCPSSSTIRTGSRSTEGRLYIADRGNQRVQVSTRRATSSR
jgi:hypothetical protein